MIKKLFHNPITLGLLVVSLFVTSEVFGLTQVALTLRTNQELSQNLLRHETFDALGAGIQGGLDGWDARIPITVSSSSVTSTLTDFPVYVDLSDLPASFFDTVKSDGSDIRVTKSDGMSEVAFELVDIDTSGAPSCASNCTGELHFLADSLSSSSDTMFYVYYGNAAASAYAATDTYGSEAVWENYYAVFHLNEAVNTTSGGYANSTGGGDGTGVGMAETAVAGALGGQAQDLTAGDHITFTESVTSENTVTMSAWIYPDTSQDAYVGLLESRDSGLKGLLDSGGGSNELTTAWDGNAAEFNLDTNLNWSTGSWQYVAGVVDTGTITTYLDGASYTQIGSNAIESASSWYIGTDPSYIGSRSWEGYMDEIRIAKDALSDDWMQAEYLNQSNPTSFYTVGGEDTGVLTPIAQATAGRLGQAALFDGVDDSIDLGDLGGTVRTIAFWIKTDDTTTQEVIDIDGTDHIELNGSSQISAVSFPGTTATYIDGESGSTITTGWHHVVITDTTGVNAGAVVLGEVGGTYFDGTLDDVRFYTEVLSDAAIKRLYELGATTKISTSIFTNSALDEGLVSHWTFDTSDGIDLSQSASIRDRIGSNHGTPYNMATSWFGSWDYRVSVTINASQVSSTLSDFPVYVDLSDLPAAFFSNVKGDGGDIRVVENDGLTETPFELVSISTSTSAGELYFKADEISDAADTTFYIYYGNASASGYAATDTYGAENVWVGYDMVHHLEDAVADSTSGGVLDSTSNSQDGTPANFSDGGGGSTGVAAKFGNGADFAGDDDYIDLGSFTPASAGTVSLWFNMTSTKLQRPYGGDDRYEFRFDAAGNIAADFLIAGGAGASGGNITTTGTWFHLVATYDDPSDTVRTFVDGEFVGSKTDSDDPMGAGYTTYLGRSASAQYFDGLLDELRVSSSVRSDAWIEAEYANMNSPGTFYTVGTQETPGAGNPQTFLRPGRLSQAIEMNTLANALVNGLTPYVLLGTNSSLDITLPLTVAAWIKPEDLGVLQPFVLSQMIVGKGSEVDDGLRWAFTINGSYTPLFAKVNDDGVTAVTLTANTALDPDEWAHVIFAADAAGDWSMYINGSQDATGTMADTTFNSTSDQGYIGVYYVPGNPSGALASSFVGQLDDIRIYDRALSQEEAQRLYGLGATTHIGVTNTNDEGVGGRGLINHWTFDGVTGIDLGATGAEIIDRVGGSDGSLGEVLDSSNAVPGKIGQGMQFDGVEEYIDFGNASGCVDGGGLSYCPETISFWLKADDITSRPIMELVAETSIEINASGQIIASGFAGTPTIYVDGEDATQITTGWHHVVVTDIPELTAFEIGRVGASFFDGTIDDVRVFDYIFSAEDAARLANI